MINKIISGIQISLGSIAAVLGAGHSVVGSEVTGGISAMDLLAGGIAVLILGIIWYSAADSMGRME